LRRAHPRRLVQRQVRPARGAWDASRSPLLELDRCRARVRRTGPSIVLSGPTPRRSKQVHERLHLVRGPHPPAARKGQERRQSCGGVSTTTGAL
jgi:hypothetical protein